MFSNVKMFLTNGWVSVFYSTDQIAFFKAKEALHNNKIKFKVKIDSLRLSQNIFGREGELPLSRGIEPHVNYEILVKRNDVGLAHKRISDT